MLCSNISQWITNLQFLLLILILSAVLLFTFCYLKNHLLYNRRKGKKALLSPTKYQISFWKLLFFLVEALFMFIYYRCCRFHRRSSVECLLKQSLDFVDSTQLDSTWLCLILTVVDGRIEALRSSRKWNWNWWKLKVVWALSFLLALQQFPLVYNFLMRFPLSSLDSR